MMLLHDLADPLLEGAKLFNYTALKVLADSTLCVFAAVFAVTRLWIYPRYLLWPIVQYRGAVAGNAYWVIVAWLVGLQVLHVYWMLLVGVGWVGTDACRLSRLP